MIFKFIGGMGVYVCGMVYILGYVDPKYDYYVLGVLAFFLLILMADFAADRYRT